MFSELLSNLSNHILYYHKVQFLTNIALVVMLLMRIVLHQTALPSPVEHPVPADDTLSTGFLFAQAISSVVLYDKQLM